MVTFEGTIDNDQSQNAKKKRKMKSDSRAKKACIYCSQSHASCTDGMYKTHNRVEKERLYWRSRVGTDTDHLVERPCKRCVSKGIGHLCTDKAFRKKRGRKAARIFEASARLYWRYYRNIVAHDL